MRRIYQLIKLQKIKFTLINHKLKNLNQIEMYNLSQEVSLRNLILQGKQLIGFSCLPGIDKF